MPMSKAGRKIKAKLKEQYGSEKGEGIFYAMENKGKIPGMKKGYAKGGMVKNGNTDRRGKGMFYDSKSPRGYK
jgi:hypothetical protein